MKNMRVKMTAKELASKLDKNKSPQQFIKDIHCAKRSNLIVIWANGDTIDIFGAFSCKLNAEYHDRVFEFYLHDDGVVDSPNDYDDGLCQDCPVLGQHRKDHGVLFRAIRMPKEPNADWVIKTSIPHETFDIIDKNDEEGVIVCRGVVVNVDNLPEFSYELPAFSYEQQRAGDRLLVMQNAISNFCTCAGWWKNYEKLTEQEKIEFMHLRTKKIVEESEELVQALEDGNLEHAREEAADVLFVLFDFIAKSNTDIIYEVFRKLSINKERLENGYWDDEKTV